MPTREGESNHETNTAINEDHNAATGSSALASMAGGSEPGGVEPMSGGSRSSNLNSFDKLPNELVARIFTIGTEYDPNRRRKRRFESLSNITSHRLPYTFISLVGSVCRRFHSLTRFKKSTAHFYCISAFIGQRRRATSTIFDVVQFHWALKASEGCDIVLRLGLSRLLSLTNHEEVTMRLLLHALRCLTPYKRQVASIELQSYDYSLPLLAWIIRWLGSDNSFQRLQVLTLEFSGNCSETSSIDTSLFEHFGFPSARTDVVFHFPSIVHLIIDIPTKFSSGMKLPILSQTSCLHSLRLHPELLQSSRPFYNWSAIAAIIIATPTLRCLEFVLQGSELQNAESPPNLCVETETLLEELVAVLDSQSLVILFRTFRFPHLKTAAISIPGFGLPEETPPPALQLPDVIRLPSLESLMFTDFTPNPCPFLQSCVLPNLESLHLAVRRFQPREDAPTSRLNSPKQLTIGVGKSDDSLSWKLGFLDLSQTENISIYAGDKDLFRNELLIGPGEGYHRQNLSNLDQIGLCGVEFFDAVNGLNLLFRLPPTFSLDLDEHYHFDFTHTSNSGLLFEINNATLIYRYQRPMFYFRPRLWALESSLNRRIPAEDDRYIRYIPSPTEVFKFGDSTHPAFANLKRLTLCVPRESYAVFTNDRLDPTDTGWIRFLAICVCLMDDKGMSKGIPFPGLVELRVLCETIVPEGYAIVRDQCWDMFSVRKAAGSPMQFIKLYQVDLLGENESEEGLTDVITNDGERAERRGI